MTSFWNITPLPTDLEKIGEKARGVPVSASSKGLAETSRELAAEKEGRKEERFVWSLVCIVLFNVIIADQMNWHLTWILVFEFIFIFVFGRVCGVDYIYEATQRAIDTVAKMKAERATKTEDENEENA
jgi:hypothetical protein